MVLMRGSPLEAEDAGEADHHDSSLGIGEQGLRAARSSRTVDPPPIIFAGSDKQFAGPPKNSNRVGFDSIATSRSPDGS